MIFEKIAELYRKHLHRLEEKQLAEYMAGYEFNEQFGDKKDWG